MVNPIILPELRLMLAENDDEGLRAVAMELHPATVADFTEGLTVDETWRVLARAPLARQAEIFAYYAIPKQVEMVLGSGRERMSALLEEMASDNRVDLLQNLDPQVVEELLPLVAKAERHDIAMLLSYPESSAGAVMTTEYASLPANITAADALQRLRSEAPDSEMIYYIYVVDDQRHLAGLRFAARFDSGQAEHAGRKPDGTRRDQHSRRRRPRRSRQENGQVRLSGHASGRRPKPSGRHCHARRRDGRGRGRGHGRRIPHGRRRAVGARLSRCAVCHRVAQASGVAGMFVHRRIVHLHGAVALRRSNCQIGRAEFVRAAMHFHGRQLRLSGGHA